MDKTDLGRFKLDGSREKLNRAEVRREKRGQPGRLNKRAMMAVYRSHG